ncbi:MAG: hypothetical protein ABIS30_06875 [Gallionella sp.]|jgi:hypothetical protein
MGLSALADHLLMACVEDTLHATGAAVEEGIVPGGGVALLRAKAAVAKRQTAQQPLHVLTGQKPSHQPLAQQFHQKKECVVEMFSAA